MPLPPYLGSETDGKPSVFAAGFVLVTALGGWSLVAFALLMPSTGPSGAGAELALFSFIGGGILSFVGSAVCLFAVSKKEKERQPWLRWCALANYCALATVFALPIFQSCASKYR